MDLVMDWLLKTNIHVFSYLVVDWLLKTSVHVFIYLLVDWLLKTSVHVLSLSCYGLTVVKSVDWHITLTHVKFKYWYITIILLKTMKILILFVFFSENNWNSTSITPGHSALQKVCTITCTIIEIAIKRSTVLVQFRDKK
jgi:hypothetical protein